MSRGWGTIAFATRARPYVLGEFLKFWSMFLLQEMRPGDRLIAPAVGQIAPAAANTIVENFLEGTKCDSLLFVDDDQLVLGGQLSAMRDNRRTWPLDACMALIVKHGYPGGRHDTGESAESNAPIVMRVATVQPKDYDALDPRSPIIYHSVAFTVGDVVAVDAVGLGFTLMRREMLGAMANLYPRPFEYPNSPASEDIVFCRRAKLAGDYKFGIDTSVTVPHGRMEWLEWGRG